MPASSSSRDARPALDSRLGWEVSPEPSLSTGTAEGTDDFQLHRVDDALRLNDGRIIVANGGSHELLVFDEAGNYLTAWGQRGEGPRRLRRLTGPRWFEYRSLYDGSLAGGLAGRVSRWTAGGTEALHVRPGHAGTPWSQTRSGSRRSCTHLSRSAAGRSHPGQSLPRAIALPTRPEDPEKGLYRQELELFIVSGDGLSHVSLGPHPGAETFWHWENAIWDGTAFTIMQPPFQKSLVWAAWGELVVVAATERYELKAYRQDGSLARIVRRQNDIRSPTQADLDGYRAAEAPGGGADQLRPQPSGRLERPSARRILPRHLRHRGGSSRQPLGPRIQPSRRGRPGSLDRVRPGRPRLSDSSRRLRNWSSHEIGDDYILGMVRDELGVEYVQVWGLGRSG